MINLTNGVRHLRGIKCLTLLSIVLFLLLPACSKAETPTQSTHGFAVPKHQPVKAEIITQHKWFNPNTATRIGIHFDLEEGWHIYAQDPGDAGMPTQVSWQSGGPVIFGALAWPEPEHFVDAGGIKTNGYSGSVVLSSALSINDKVIVDWAAGEVGINAKVKWLACKEICLPGEADLKIQLPVKFEEAPYSANAELFESVNP